MEYDKYKKSGGLHWDWYSKGEKHNYYKLVNESLIPFEKLKGSIIDFGCGDGLVDYILTKKDFNVTGVDSSIEGMNVAREEFLKRGGNLFEYHLEDIDSYKMNKKYDYLYSLNTIEHLKNPEVMVKYMKNIRKFGVVITDDDDVVASDNSKSHIIQFNRESFKELFKDFKLEEIELSNKCFFGYKIYAN